MVENYHLYEVGSAEVPQHPMLGARRPLLKRRGAPITERGVYHEDYRNDPGHPVHHGRAGSQTHGGVQPSRGARDARAVRGGWPGYYPGHAQRVCRQDPRWDRRQAWPAPGQPRAAEFRGHQEAARGG